VGKQFGFRKGIAADDTIFKLTNEILNTLKNKKNGWQHLLWSGESFRLSQS
jgi:hypothetical protein